MDRPGGRDPSRHDTDAGRRNANGTERVSERGAADAADAADAAGAVGVSERGAAVRNGVHDVPGTDLRDVLRVDDVLPGDGVRMGDRLHGVRMGSWKVSRKDGVQTAFGSLVPSWAPRNDRSGCSALVLFPRKLVFRMVFRMVFRVFGLEPAFPRDGQDQEPRSSGRFVPALDRDLGCVSLRKDVWKARNVSVRMAHGLRVTDVPWNVRFQAGCRVRYARYVRYVRYVRFRAVPVLPMGVKTHKCTAGTLKILFVSVTSS
ncbi:MAG: hypothetical protein IJD43_11540 [Thermoguttaceae bacterium]|nr:hypothetical protein [Thermoguttaceae bacterium]